MENIISFLIAFIGLGFLIFIHELGHYIVAIKTGMKVEVFSIGFGKPIFSFQINNVKWQIGSLPFGGYVKIAGMEKVGKQEPHEIKNGFYAAKPWKRILVASAGPIVNIIFSLLVFSLLYMLGGRIQNFSQHTKIIGYVDHKSKIFEQGVKEGDEIEKIDGRNIKSFQDILMASILNKPKISVSGDYIDYFQNQKRPFSFLVEPYSDQSYGIADFKTLGLKYPAQYLIYIDQPSYMVNPIFNDSGLQSNDRIVWVNGELIFSLQQLSDVINTSQVVITAKRGNSIFLTRVPRLKISDLRLSMVQKDELNDLRHAINNNKPLAELFSIPYNLDAKGVVESVISFIDENAQPKTVYSISGQKNDSILAVGDQILAIHGEKVSSGSEIFEKLQQKKILMIVQRGDFSSVLDSKNQDNVFIQEYEPKKLSGLISKIGIKFGIQQDGNYVLLNPVQPVTKRQLMGNLEQQNKIQKELEWRISQLNNSKEKQLAVKELYDFNNKVFLGLVLQDRKVTYNPTPLQQMSDVLNQTKTTFNYLFNREISPKWLSGPVGIIQMVQKSTALGIKEFSYWMAFISLSLAIFNLIPLPVLDGGHILMSLYEQITKKPIPTKIKEFIMIPFMVLLIGMLIFVTFHDVMRIITGLFN